MKIFPGMEPQHFTHLGPDGTSASATWMVCMGLVLTFLGGVYLVQHHIWPSVRRVATYRTAPRPSGQMALQRIGE